MKYLYILVFAILFLACRKDDGVTVPGLESATPIESNVAEPELLTTLPASWDENWFASPAVYDLDGDGSNEIIASRHSVLYVWKSDGTLLWRAPVGENASTSNDHGSSRMYASPVVGDLDNDGLGEIAIAYSDQAAVYEHDGNLKTGWPQSFPGSNGEIRSIAAADLDNNGTHEILVVKTSEGPVTCVWNINGQVRSGWPQVDNHDTKNDYGGYNQNIGAVDFDNDGLVDVVSTYDICHIGVFKENGESWMANSMFSGQYSCNVPFFHDIDLAVQGWGADGNDRDEFTDSPPVFADLDNDNLPEIILFSDHELAGEYVNRGNSLWAINPDMTRVAGFETIKTTGKPLYTGYENNIVQVAPSPAISYLGTTNLHIVVPSYDGYLYCFDAEGTENWKVQFDSPGGNFIGMGEVAIGDLDNDGVPEIVFTTYSTSENVSKLYILNANGSLLHRIDIAGRGSMSAPTLADYDKDGKTEIILSLKDVLGGGDGGVQIWKVASATNSTIDWPTGRGNYLRTGEFDD
jgi:hypothetical protein